MSDTSWKFQRSKRKPPSTEPPPRKRVRVSDDVGRRNSSTIGLRRQQTLTQIQWVDNPQTSLTDSDLQQIGPENAGMEKLGKGKRKRTGKRNSTLTQMDWLGGALAAQDDTVEDMRMLEQGHREDMSVLSQLDGINHISPKRKRQRSEPRRTRQQVTPATIHRDDRRENNSAGEHRETLAAGARTDSTRRRSSRIASKALPDTENLDNMGHKLLHRNSHSARSPSKKASVQKARDTADFDKKQSPLQDKDQPRTPRQKRVVPSSQTPETLPNTKRRLYHINPTSPSKSSGRTPLREKSANIKSRTYSQGIEASKSMLGIAERSPRRRKICVLKVPGKELMKRSGPTKDSQRDVFSLPTTSSSSRNKGLSDSDGPLQSVQPRPPQKEESIEIPPTSDQATSSDHDIPSSPPVVDTQASLPELSDLFPNRRTIARKQDDLVALDPQQQVNDEVSVLVHDFGRRSQNEAAPITRKQAATLYTHEPVHDDMLLDDPVLDPEITAMSTANLEQVARPDDSDSDLGSPVANDTQFNVKMLQRISSPSSALESVATEIIDRREDMSGSPTPRRPVRIPSGTGGQQFGIGDETPIPIPKLVQNAIPTATPPRTHRDNVPTNNNAPPTSDGYETVSTEPLNGDVQRSSSSPTLPPAQPVTQKSVHPASMPRPSQMSTQVPTQGFFPSSAPVPTQCPVNSERITIKDSSSAPPRLSQIPANTDQSQGLHYNLRLEDSDGEIDDLDLDPKSSTIRGRHSARKRYDMLRKDTASSLKSIHLPLSKSSQQVVSTQDPSSSPRLEPLMPPPRRRTLGRLARAKAAPVEPDSPAQEQLHKAMARDQEDLVMHDSDPDVTSSPASSPQPAPLKRKHDPIPGFDNDTQSNFTEDGHVTAAYIHREREAGRLPDWFTPLPHQVPNWTGRAKDKRKSGGGQKA